MNSLSTRLGAGLGALVLGVGLSACGGADASTPEAAEAAPSAEQGPAGGPGASGGPGGGTSGLIAAVSGATLQVQGTAGQVAVTTTEDTTVTEEVGGTLDDVVVGTCVRVVPTSTDTGSDTGSDVPVVAASISVSEPIEGECTGGFGGFGGGPGEMPTDLPSDLPTDLPTDAMRGPGGLGTVGEVSAVADGVLTVTTTSPQDTTSEVSVQTSGETTVTTTRDAEVAAAKTGLCVVAMGEADDTGAVTASSLRLSAAVDGACTTGFGGSR